MRGKAYEKIITYIDGGITPAYAGKRWPLMWSVSTSRDHPRVCGEKFVSRTSKGIKVGSPPRMRGKVSKSL